MGRTKGAKNKVKTTTKTINRNKNTNINNVHVHVEKPKTRKKRTTKPKPEEPNNNPLSNTIGLSRPSSQNLGFHPRGLINNEPQQPTIINIQPTAQVAELEKKLKKYKDKLKSHKDAQDTTNQNLLTQLTTTPPQPNITVTQPPINVNVNPFKPPVKTEQIEKAKTPLKKSVVRFPKSRTKVGTAFKPSDLDETASVASMHSSIAGVHGDYQEPTKPEEIEQMRTRAAERLAKFHARQSKEEKKLENKLYSLKGSGSKDGSIKHLENAIKRLHEELNKETKPGKRGQIESKINKNMKALEKYKEELQQVEAKLKEVRESREPVPKGRPASILSTISNFLSPAKV